MHTILFFLSLFLVGMLEETLSIFYYKLVQKHYKVICALVSFVRTMVWAFVISGIITNMDKVWTVVLIYAFGGAIGDYVSLSIEPQIEKSILKLQRKGRKSKWGFLVGERKK